MHTPNTLDLAEAQVIRSLVDGRSLGDALQRAQLAFGLSSAQLQAVSRNVKAKRPGTIPPRAS